MLNDVEWAEDGVYTPQGEHTPHEFFSNALSNSLMFDIELGYFKDNVTLYDYNGKIIEIEERLKNELYR